MKARTSLVLCLAGAVLAGCGSGSPQADQTRRLDAIRRATRLFASPNAALARGYLQVPGCIQSSDGSGALGTLFVSRSAPKNRVDLDHPQELFYDLNPAHGSRPFLGVGYVVDNTGQRPPSTELGHMDGPLPGVLPGQPSHFELHAWLFRPSPDGILSFWNRNVSC